MTYNFDEIIDRQNTACIKYDARGTIFGKADVLPMWVADMDFRTPGFVMEAIRERATHEILGYSLRTDAYFESLIQWLKRRHNWNIRKEWVAFSPGIVPAVNVAVLAYTQQNDKIIVQPPVYFPFFGAVKDHKRELVFNPLIMRNGRYQMDYDNLEQLCSDGARMLIISNPHNPAGNAWTPAELKQMADICLKYNVLMVSDEIHCDLVNRGFKHTVLASLSPEISMQTITMVAPSKTFNLAGLATASVIIENPELLEAFNKTLNTLHIGMGNVFGNVASQAAYTHGDEWLDQLIDYIDGNIQYAMDFIAVNLPQLRAIRPEATYMVWIDFSKLGLSDEELNRFVIHKAGLGLNQGIQFGPGGEGFMRMNLACPRSVVEKGMARLMGAF